MASDGDFLDVSAGGPLPARNDQVAEYVRVDELREADSPRAAGTDPVHVNRLAQSDAELPPILVHRKTMQVIDGMHRLEAARKKGMERILAVFFDGSDADALVLSISENVRHGLPLSLADRKAAARRVLAVRPDLSDRAVAATTGLAAKTVKEIRVRSTAENPQLNARVGRDGRVRVKDAEQRDRIAAIIAQRPNASLREIAREARASPSTVLKVRNELGGGRASTDQEASDERKEQDATISAPVDPGSASRDLGGRVPAAVGLEPDIEAHAILEKLRRDPAVRMSDSGRGFVRWLERQVVVPSGLPVEMSWLPRYHVAHLAALARGCAEAWNALADLLESQGS